MYLNYRDGNYYDVVFDVVELFEDEENNFKKETNSFKRKETCLKKRLKLKEKIFYNIKGKCIVKNI